jgi:hypothetical protein
VAGSNDLKAVAAIEKLIGQAIPWMSEPMRERQAPQPTAAAPRHQDRAPRRGDHPRGNRKPQRPGAAIARIEEARPRRTPPPASAHSDDGDASHLPAFLLRPVPIKA